MRTTPKFVNQNAYPRLAEIIRWRDEKRRPADDNFADEDDFRQKKSKVKWTQKRVDSLIIAERSAKIRDRLRAQDRLLDEQITYLDYQQYRASRYVDHQMDRVRLEHSQTTSHVSLPLDELQIPLLRPKPKPRFKVKDDSKDKRVSQGPGFRRPSTAIGIRLDKVGDNWGGSSENLDSVPPMQSPRRKSIFGNIYNVSTSPSVQSLATDMTSSRGTPSSWETRLRPSTAPGQSRRRSVSKVRRPRSAWDEKEDMKALEEYKRKQLRWKHSFK